MTTETPKNGLHTEYYDNGQKKEEVNYKNGELNGKWTEWYENGQIKSICFLEDGYFIGARTYWDENGRKSFKSEDTPDGYKMTFFDDNEKKRSEQNYDENDKKNGKSTYWYENGQISAVKKYKNGKVLSWVAWDEEGMEKNMEPWLKNENESRNRSSYSSSYDSTYSNHDGISWLDQQALTDDEKLLGEDFWRGIL